MGTMTPLPTLTHWHGLTDYAAGVLQQEALVKDVADGAPEQIILCEHNPILTLGSSAKPSDAQGPHSIPVVESTRGGQVTYHGPGQRVVYPILKLDERFKTDIRIYMRRLQQWVAAACLELGVEAEIRSGEELGLWIGNAKLAAFGVRVRKGVVFHGAALNVSNDLEIYKHFTPCGIKGSAATRLIDHMPDVTMDKVDAALASTLPQFIEG